METGERLSAYLAGELDADDAAALEAELAGDPALRARLERIRSASDALAELPAVGPPAEFSARLRDAVRDEVARHQGGAGTDELAQRRAKRAAGAQRWAGVAVAAAAVGVLGAIGISNLVGGDQRDVSSVALDRGEGDRTTSQAATADPLAPYVRVTDTDHDEDSVQRLAEQRGVTDLPETINQEDARELEASRYGPFGLTPRDQTFSGGDGDAHGPVSGGTTGASVEGDSAEDTAADDTTQSEMAESTDEDAQPLASPEPASPPRAGSTTRANPLNDVRRCLPEIIETASQQVIPLFAEVASFEGEPAIIYLVLTREPEARFFNRVEAWVVGRTDCFPRLFRQLNR